jgi:hypothetical protein
MKSTHWLWLIGLALAAYLAARYLPLDKPCPDCPDGKCPVPQQAPPDGDLVQASVGGNTAPDGTEIQLDLPGNLHRRNTASRGLGNCVFTSIHHAALWQSEPALQEFPKWLIDKGIPGGGYPQKVEQLIPKISADRKLPAPEYVQIEGADLDMLKLACRTGRMPSVTYSVSPTGRYNGQRIAHMVTLVHADDRWFGVLDNNYPGPDKIEWMSPEEFKRAYTGGRSGWSVILLNPGPPPPPRN